MGFGNFAFCTRHGMFDVRHYMILGAVVMSGVLLLVSQSSLQARVIDPGLMLSNRFAPVPKNFRLKTFGTAKVMQEAQNVTRVASIKAENIALKFSPKERVSCSVEAARAAANGDTSKISPCITALLSGDEDAIVNLPEKMSAFFIETMNSDTAPEDMGKVMINSMMRMMEALSSGVKGSDESPEKTATTP